MKQVISEELDGIPENVPLDDKYAHIFIEYNQRVDSLQRLTEQIRIAGGNILEIITLREELGGNRSILVKLDIQDTREIVLDLLKHGLLKVRGYNQKVKPNL